MHAVLRLAAVCVLHRFTTILWHAFAFNEHLKGLTAEELRYAVLGPGLDPSFLDDARQKFVASSAYLDRPAAPLRFLTESKPDDGIRRQELRRSTQRGALAAERSDPKHLRWRGAETRPVRVRALSTSMTVSAVVGRSSSC